MAKLTQEPAAAVPATSQLIQQAMAHHEAGRLRQAAEIYDRILKAEPNNADALHYSGLLAHQTGHTDLAVSLMERAIRLEPGCAHYHLNLATVLDAAGELDKAIAGYTQAVSLDPTSETAHYKLGHAQIKKEEFAAAATSFSAAVRINPSSHLAISGLGLALQGAGRLDQAIVCYQKALTIAPGSIEALNNLGTVLHKLCRYGEAVAIYTQALAVQPDSADVINNLGESLRSQGKLDEAVECYRKAIKLRPGMIDARLNLGKARRNQGLLREATSILEEAISLAPENALLYSHLGDTLAEQDRIEEAIKTFQRGIDAVKDSGPAQSALLYYYSFTSRYSPAEECARAKAWERTMLTDAQRSAARQRSSARSGVFAAEPLQGRKLRLGIVSAELGAHVVAVFLQSLVDHLDRNRVELTLFPTKFLAGSRAEHFRQIADHYVQLVGIPDETAAEIIRAHKIDVLIDTTGHTDGSRLGIFAHRAAPVQCSYIGYWSTTGLTEMDWYITDEHYSAGCDSHFVEGLWRLPHVAHCYTGDDSIPESAWTPDPNGTIWLGSFNRFSKTREDALRLWAKVMKALPQSRLLLVARAEHEEETHERILTQLARFGVSRDRVEFIPCNGERTLAQVMKLYDRVDIALDTIPFNSGTTACDALWMGVPLVAIEGNRIPSRMASSIVRSIGHPEWVAKNEEEYTSIVCALAEDVEGRKKLRQEQRIRMKNSELCDGKGLARTLEDAFEAMYNKWLAS